MKREVISFRQLIPAGTRILFRERLKSNGLIRSFSYQFYQGQLLQLRIEPVVWKKKAGLTYPLVTYATNTQNYLSGENESGRRDLSFEIENDDEIWVTALNLAGFDVNMVIDVEVDYIS